MDSLLRRSSSSSRSFLFNSMARSWLLIALIAVSPALPLILDLYVYLHVSKAPAPPSGPRLCGILHTDLREHLF
jgi:hypothetical protein